MGFVEGASQPQGAGRRRLGLDREVGEHVPHQRLLDKWLAERGALACVMDRRRGPPAKSGAGADHAVQPRVVDHVDDRRYAASLLADEPRPGASELDLAGGIRAVSELVLEALDVEAVALPIGGEAGQKKAREATVGLRQDEERVAHGRRAEPLVSGELVLRPRPA